MQAQGSVHVVGEMLQLMSPCGKYLEESRRRLNGVSSKPLAQAAEGVRSALWSADANSAPGQNASQLTEHVQRVHNLVNEVVSALPALEEALAKQPSAPEEELQRDVIIGFSGAGTLGCADPTGKYARWKPFLNKKVGALAAFKT